MKIEEKKLRTWGTIVLLLGMVCLLLFVLRIEERFDQLNIILSDLLMLCSVAGVILRLVEATKIHLRTLQIIKEGKFSIG